MLILEGQIVSWTSSLGFGFVEWSQGGSGTLFVDARALVWPAHPQPGDLVRYQVARDERGFYTAVAVEWLGPPNRLAA